MILAAAALAGLATAGGLPAAALTFAAYTGLSWLLSTLFISERQRRAPADLQARIGIAGRMLLLGTVTVGSALTTSLAGTIGLRTTYLAMATAAAGITILIAVPITTSHGNQHSHHTTPHTPGPPVQPQCGTNPDPVPGSTLVHVYAHERIRLASTSPGAHLLRISRGTARPAISALFPGAAGGRPAAAAASPRARAARRP